MMEKELPEGWVQRKVSDFMSEVLDKVDPTVIEETIYIGLEHIGSSGGVISFGSSKEVKSLKTIFKKGDVLYGKLRPYLDKHDVAKHDGICSTDILVFRNPNEDSSKYFNYYLGLNSTISRAHEDSSGINLPRISSKKLGDFIIPTPPLPEQKRIVAKLDALFGHLDILKEKLDRIPKLLKSFRQQVLTKAVTGELTKEWREGRGLGEWEIEPLKKLGKWVGGGTPSKAEPSFWKKGDILWITPKDMKNIFISDSIDKITFDAVENSSANLIPANSVLFVTRSGILRRILPISQNLREATVNQDLKALIPRNGLGATFLLYSLVGLEKKIRINCMKSGTTVESIEFSLLKEYQIGIPTFEEQQEIVTRVDSLFEFADKIETRYQSLKAKIDQLPQAILAKAFRGELVEQEVKEYGREAGEVMMEGIEAYKVK